MDGLQTVKKSLNDPPPPAPWLTKRRLQTGKAKVTIVANQKTLKNVKADDYWVGASFDVTVKEAQKMTVKATGANELTATVASPVDAASASAVVVKRGTTTINASAKISGKEIVITTDAKMIKGEYTVTLGELSASCEVEDQKVAEIVITGEGDFVAATSTTNANPTDALDGIIVFYDVLDQYGDSLRTASTLQWSGSLTKRGESVQDGYVIFGSSDGSALIYGTTVFLTAVYNKNANVVTKSAEVKVGLEGKTDEVIFAGVTDSIVDVKIKDSLTTDFAISGRAYLLFTVNSQYKTPMDMSNFDFDDVTFTSTTPLLLAVDKTVHGTVTVDQVTYGYVLLKSDANTINTAKGGTAVISAVSAKTGKKVDYSLDITADQVLTKFKIGVPADIVSEGRTVEIPFTAEDQNGKAITDYRVLNGAVSFSTSAGTLEMKEKDDGSAKLYYTAPTTGAEEDVDLYVTMTSVVTNSGSVDSQNFYVKQKARPAAIAEVQGDKVLLEGGSVTIYDTYQNSWTNRIVYVDQYGRKLDNDFGRQTAEINDWFAESGNYVAVDFTGVAKLGFARSGNSKTITGLVTRGVNESYSETVKFELKSTINNVADTLVPGSTKKVTYKVVDISSLVSFSAKELGLGYASAQSASDPADYVKKIKVTGKMSDGTEVKVPHTFSGAVTYFDLTVSDNTWDHVTKYAATDVSVSADEITLNSSSMDADSFKQYDAVSQRYYGKKDEKLSVKVTINDVNSNTQKDAIALTLDVSNDTPAVEAVKAGYDVADGKAVINPTNGVVTASAIRSGAFVEGDLYDKYGVIVDSSANLSITVSKIVEKNTKTSPVVVSNNASTNVSIAGLEIGDTFEVTYTSANYKTLTVKFTVGADTLATFGTKSGRKISAMY